MVNESIRIGNLELKNRIVMPPMATYLSMEDGKVTEPLLAYYGERAEGGKIGLIITEHSFITLQGKAKDHQLSAASDDDIEGLGRLVQAIHQNGTMAMAQLNHAGAAAPSSVTGCRAVGASSVVLPVSPMMGDGTEPLAATKEQIKEITASFAAAAGRVKAAGFDGVEIHSAHAYLLNEFYSPLTNHREDEYGGTLDNRLRFHCEVIRAVREAVGDDFVIAVRLGGCDYMEGGSTVKDSVYAAKILESAGIDLIDISGGMCRYTRKGHNEPGYFRDVSSAIKKEVSIPVILTGGVKTMEEADALLSENVADLIGIGRELFRNPKWPDKKEE